MKYFNLLASFKDERMKNKLWILLACFVTSIMIPLSSYAWTNSVSLGYGISHDPNNTRYNNSGFLLNADFYSLYRTEMTYWTLGGSLGQWHSNAPVNQNLTTAALSLDLRVYLFNFSEYYPAYLLGSAGPAIMSNRDFGLNEQASNLSIQTTFGLGVELEDQWDVNLRAAHYSNAGLGSPNEGFNVLYVLSIGYLF